MAGLYSSGASVKKIRITWFDDDARRVEKFRPVLEHGRPGARVTLEFVPVKSSALIDLQTWLESAQDHPPDLVIIDHVFAYAPALPFKLQGSSVAHLLRLALASVPMVCVTAKFDKKPDLFDEEDLSEYTALFPFQHLGQHLESLFAIARDFKKLQVDTEPLREHVIDCVKAPKWDRERVLQILPEEFRGGKVHTTSHRVARWIWNAFLYRPGFLYDRLAAATLLGLNEDGFRKVEDLFTKALYKGVFSTTSEPRWWVSTLLREIYRIAPESAESSQHLGRKLPGIHTDDFSVCFSTKLATPPPDSVVYVDASPSAKRVAVSRKFSERHPSDQSVAIGFDTKLVLMTMPK